MGLMVKFGILDHLTECSVEAELLGSEGPIQCFACTDEDRLPDQISELRVVEMWHEIMITAKTLRRLHSCRAIVRVGVGYDNVDHAYAGEIGIPVVNIPDYGTNVVADHTVALLLALSRKLERYNEAVRNNPVKGWDHKIAGELFRLSGAVLGIVRLGRIGTAVALRAKAFGMKVAFYDPYLPDGYEKTYQVKRFESLRELVERSDFLSIHAPLTEETEGMINRDVLKHCKQGMTLINTARSKTVSGDAVYEALADGRLRGYAADVLEPEPPDSTAPLIEAFFNRETWLDGRVLLTPHAAFYTKESRREMRVKAAEHMLRAARGLPLRNCVNSEYLREPRTPVFDIAHR
jgi:lactate dehydrogenase-like 2-hydroxyacid dehydrogenase